MRNVCEDMDIYRYAFVLKEEAARAFENERLLLLQAPPGTDIQVGQPAIVRLSLHLRIIQSIDCSTWTTSSTV